ncbi:hypothetical protein QVA66_03790 [Staphylococcus chromogenes]|nr:hypothetical protein [Staphylococcus chromogenes]
MPLKPVFRPAEPEPANAITPVRVGATKPQPPVFLAPITEEEHEDYRDE